MAGGSSHRRYQGTLAPRRGVLAWGEVCRQGRGWRHEVKLPLAHLKQNLKDVSVAAARSSRETQGRSQRSSVLIVVYSIVSFEVTRTGTRELIYS